MDMWAAPPERGVYTHYTPTGAARLDRIYVPTTKGTETWDRNGSDRIHGSFGCNPTYCLGRDHHPSWSQLLENGRGTGKGSRCPGNCSAEMDVLETTAEPVPSHSNVVGEGGQEPKT